LKRKSNDPACIFSIWIGLLSFKNEKGLSLDAAALCPLLAVILVLVVVLVLIAVLVVVLILVVILVLVTVLVIHVLFLR
jgi:hypothetical protein